MFCFVLFCFVLFCFVLFRFLFCFVLFCFVSFVLFCFVLFCFVLFCFVSLVLFCFVLFCFVLFCFFDSGESCYVTNPTVDWVQLAPSLRSINPNCEIILTYGKIMFITELAQSRTADIFIRETACFHCDSMNYDQIRVKPTMPSYHGVAKYDVSYTAECMNSNAKKSVLNHF